MQFEHVFAVRLLMQPIHVLCDDRRKLPLLFQLCECSMRAVWQSIRYQKRRTVIRKKSLRVLHEKAVRQKHLRRLAKGTDRFKVAIPAAKVGDAAFRGYSRAAQKGDSARCADHRPKLADFLFHAPPSC